VGFAPKKDGLAETFGKTIYFLVYALGYDGRVSDAESSVATPSTDNPSESGA